MQKDGRKSGAAVSSQPPVCRAGFACTSLPRGSHSSSPRSVAARLAAAGHGTAAQPSGSRWALRTGRFVPSQLGSTWARLVTSWKCQRCEIADMAVATISFLIFALQGWFLHHRLLSVPSRKHCSREVCATQCFSLAMLWSSTKPPISCCLWVNFWRGLSRIGFRRKLHWTHDVWRILK